jgi:hypothetical protein
MEKTGSINDRIFNSALQIGKGRVFRDTPKLEAIGRVIFNDGIAAAKEAFKDADATNDLKTIIQAQMTFVKQDLSLCDPKNNYAARSFQASITDLQDSLNSLTVLEIKGTYPDAEQTYSTRRPTDRVGNLPKDVVYKALTSEITRLANSLNSNMASPVERELVIQRMGNMRHGRELYKEMQKKVLGYVPKVKSKGEREIE